jgi:hypothetical protein
MVGKGCPQGVVGQLPVEAGHVAAHAKYIPGINIYSISAHALYSPDADAVAQVGQMVGKGCPQGVVGQLPVEAGHVATHAQYSPDSNTVVQVCQMVGEGRPQRIVGQLPVEAGHIEPHAQYKPGLNITAFLCMRSTHLMQTL